MLLMGPEAGGKTTIGKDLVKNKNSSMLDYCKFLEDNALEDQSDETKAQNFI
jgi:shikimate kinase